MNEIVSIHFIDEKTDKIIIRPLANHVPRVGEEIRFGGDGNEKYYSVTHVVWVYDEQENPYERVNIGVSKCA